MDPIHIRKKTRLNPESEVATSSGELRQLQPLQPLQLIPSLAPRAPAAPVLSIRALSEYQDACSVITGFLSTAEIQAAWQAGIGREYGEKTPSDEHRKNILAQDGMQLAHLPMALRNLALCQTALQQNANAWRHVPKRLRDNPDLGLAKIALNSDGRALRLLAPELRTPELLELAVANHAAAMCSIPKNQQTQTMYQAARSQANQDSGLLALIKIEDRTPAMYLAAIKQEELFCSDVPASFRSNEIYYAAITHNNLSLDDVPEAERNSLICVAALKNDPADIAFVPTTLKQQDSFWQECIKSGALVLNKVPNRLRADGKLDQLALICNGANLQFIEAKKRTQVLCEIAITHDAMAFTWVPAQHRSALIETVLKKDGRLIDAIFDVEFKVHSIYNARANKLIDLAIENTPHALTICPPESRSLARCIAAVKRAPEVLKVVPAEHLFISPELQKIALFHYQENLLLPLWDSLDAVPTRQEHKHGQPHELAQRPQQPPSYPPYLNGLMLEHLLRLFIYDKRELLRNPLCKNIPIEFIAAAQKSIEILQNTGFISEQAHSAQSSKLIRGALNLGVGRFFSISSSSSSSSSQHSIDESAIYAPVIARSPHLLGVLPEAKRTPALCALAVRIDGNALEHVPKSLANEALCLSAFASAREEVLGLIKKLNPALAAQLA